MKQREKKRKKRLLWLIPVLVLVLLFSAAAIYVNDYYPAGETALQALASDEQVSVTRQENFYIFQPAVPTDSAGLIFYPGGKVDEQAYAPLLRQLAEQGIPVVLVRMPFRLAVLRSQAAGAVIETLPEIDTWYIGGHSLGGAMAAAYAARQPEQLSGIILLAAYPPGDLAAAGLPLLSVYGSEDQVLNMDRYLESRADFPAISREFVIVGGNHAFFADYGEQKGDGEALISARRQQDLAVDQIVGFIRDQSGH